MELWIRSQNGLSLIKPSRLILEKYNNNYIIKEAITYEHRVFLGEYKTEEKARKILNEIHNLDIENNPNIKANCYAYATINIVYTMPKE